MTSKKFGLMLLHYPIIYCSAISTNEVIHVYVNQRSH